MYDVLVKRIDHLKSHDYFEMRVYRLIVDYMLREQHYEAAKSLIEELDMHEFSDLEVFLESSEIIDNL